jgi:hypothetical protein
MSAEADSARPRFPKPVDFDQLYPGRFLKSGELLGKKVTVVIDDVSIDELEGDKGKQVKGILYLRGKNKQIVLNKTNGTCLKAMFGRKLGDWVGKRIVIFQSTTKFGADTVDCIRIWGSPEIDKDMVVTINPPRKRSFTMTMHKTGNGKSETREPGADDDAAPADEE